ncbi:MAG: hypothetical protein ACLFS8_07775 [Clostridia bacterium]
MTVVVNGWRRTAGLRGYVRSGDVEGRLSRNEVVLYSVGAFGVETDLRNRRRVPNSLGQSRGDNTGQVSPRFLESFAVSKELFPRAYVAGNEERCVELVALRVIGYGFTVLLVAIGVNVAAGMLGWSTWYDYLGNVAKEGIVSATRSLAPMELGFLFFLYPLLLGLSVHLFVRLGRLQ